MSLECTEVYTCAKMVRQNGVCAAISCQDDKLKDAFNMVEMFVHKYECMNKSEETVKKYRGVMKRLLRHFYLNDMSVDPNNIGEKEVHAIINMDVSDNTKVNYLIILKKFTTMMSDKNKKNTSISDMDIKFNVVIKNKKTIEYEDYLYLINKTKNPALKIAFMLGGELGLRRSEIVNLKIQDIQGKWLTVVRGKGNKTSRLPINDVLADGINEYLKDRNRLIKKYGSEGITDSLIVYESDSRLISLGYTMFYKWMNKETNKMGIKTSPHALRSMYITNKLDSGVPPHITQLLARHKNVETTVRYYRPRDDLLIMAQNVTVDRCDPVQNAKRMYNRFV